MELKTHTFPGGVTVVHPIGRLDLTAAAEFKQRLSLTIAEGQLRLVVDLAEVSFIDSSGLGALISSLKAARLAGGDLRIARPSDQARVILQLTALERVFHPFARLEDALADY